MGPFVYVSCVVNTEQSIALLQRRQLVSASHLLHLDQVDQPSHQRPTSILLQPEFFCVTKHLHLHCAWQIEFWQACFSDIRPLLK